MSRQRRSGESSGSDVLLVALKPDALSETQLANLTAAAADLRVVVSADRRRIEELLPDIRVVVGMFPRDLIRLAPKLAWLHQWGAGADWLLEHPQVAELDFVLTNSAGVHAVPISEHVFAFLLSFARGFPRAVRDQVAGRWRPQRQAELFELEGKTLLLVGSGRIGERIAVLARAFGLHVVAVRRDALRPVEGAHEVHGADDLDTHLPRADFVVLTVPLTVETRGMFAASRFAAMKESAYLVNIGRGGTVKEADLIAALKNGEIAGAGLDVFEEEPLPADSPLWALENVIVTAHYSGATPRYVERVLDIFLDNLERYKRGEPLKNVVDKKLGY